MQDVNEYMKVLSLLYEKSLILEDMSDMHPVLKFYYFDALAHLDFSISMLAYNFQNPRNLLSKELLRLRIEESKKEGREYFPGFMKWLLKEHTEQYELFPLFIQKIYSTTDLASYRSFQIVLDPDTKSPTPAGHFRMMIDEMFDRSYLNSLYNGSKTATFFEEYMNSSKNEF